MKDLYLRHVAERQRKAEAALDEAGFDELVLGSGTPFTHFADDQDAPFRTNPHFAHWTPLAGPHHLLVVRSARKPLLVRVAPEDYWYDQAPIGDPFWKEAFELVEVGSVDAAWKELSTNGRRAFIGDAGTRATELGLAANPADLIHRLDWGRSHKSDYEVACLVEAEKQAGRGHAAARAAFLGGASELELHQVYVSAVGCTDDELPYPTIVALDSHGATLHYTGKRTERNGKVFLLDAGAKHLGYASDVTRTWTSERCDGTFRDLVRGMDALQQELCARVKPGLDYFELHKRAHVQIGDLLRELRVLKLGGEDALARGVTRPFFPHGLGHFLGIQVHDVSGHQRNPAGGRKEPPKDHPYLRTTRMIEERQVFTVEPGCYFIPMLLREHRSGATKDAFDWKLVDRLTSCGGVRIEDNVLVTAIGHENLTRPWLDAPSKDLVSPLDVRTSR